MKRASLLVLLVLEAWTAWAKPSEATSVGAATGGVKLMDRETILQECLCCRPTTLNTPQAMAGAWCGLINSYENETYPDPDCHRLTVVPDNDRLGIVYQNIRNGQIHSTKNLTYNKIENGSWLYTTDKKVSNFFFGFSEGGTMLLLCGTVTERGKEPTEVCGMAYGRCLSGPGDREQAEAGHRPMVQVCEELPASTPASA